MLAFFLSHLILAWMLPPQAAWILLSHEGLCHLGLVSAFLLVAPLVLKSCYCVHLRVLSSHY